MPYLPELESVEGSEPIVLLAVPVMVVPACLFLLMTYVYWPWFGPVLPLAIAGDAAMVALTLWGGYRGLTGNYFWKTDTEGLFARSLLRRRFIRWSDVRCARIRRGWLQSGYLDVSGTGQVISIPLESTRLPPASLIASVWQHSRDARGVGEFALPRTASSFWDRIPDAVPEETEWENRRDRTWLLSLVTFTLTGTLVLLMHFDPGEARPLPLYVAVPMVAVFALMSLALWLRYRHARTYCLSSQAIGARRRSHLVRLPWTEVRNAFWAADTAGSRMLVIQGRERGKTVRIPFDPKSADCGRFILSAIRQLRRAGIVLSIPNLLRIARPCAASQSANRVELGIPRGLMCIWIGYLVIVSLLWLLRPSVSGQPRQPGDVAAGLVTLAVPAVSLVLARRYKVTADANGIARQTAFGTRSVAWSEVAAYEKTRETATGAFTGIRLKDAQGHTLLRFGSGSSLLGDWEALVAFADLKLQHLIPPPSPDEQWLARPWGVEV